MSGRFVFAVAIGLSAGVGAACSNPAGPDIVVEPIQVDRVDVRILESSPPQAAAHVVGVIGDGCATLQSVRQARSGNTVTVTILRQRPRVAVCIQIALLYDAVIPLEGQFPPGTYLLRVNGVERTFTTD